MKFTFGLVGISFLGLLSGGFVGCSADTTTRGTGGGGGDKPDLVFVFPDVDLASGTDDAGPSDQPTVCGDTDPTCIDFGEGPVKGGPFPLGKDPNKDPNEADDGVNRDPMGWLGLDSTHATFDFLLVANSGDWNRGTLTKINITKVQEVARYLSVTCNSNPTGSKAMCDGTNGCCAGDDGPRFVARQANQAQPSRQSIQLTTNSPSRTAIDFNGDLFVANRAFGGQSSVTKIAGDVSECRDRNKNGKIDTSSDANGDGVIQTDCNGNNVMDDLDDIKTTPCLNGAKQEFFGLDDECVLWTTNTNATSNQYGRPLGLGPGAIDGGPSDAWAGTYNDGKFFRLDGTTGQTKEEADLPKGCNPYGLVIDSSGYGWSPTLLSGPLCYFNTQLVNKKHDTAQARGTMVGYGVALDRDQNIWIGGYSGPDAYRYKPDRSNGWTNLGMGNWVHITKAGHNAGASSLGRGIAADSRTANQYWVWLADNSAFAVRLPGSDLDNMVPKNMDVTIDGSAFPAVKVAGANTMGIGVDRDQNIWSVAGTGAVVTRTLVDKNGNMTPPVLNAAPMGNNKCPAGDTCPFRDNNHTNPSPYTYSDFTGFGLRNFTRPKGTYDYVVKGCVDGQGMPADTRWFSVVWDADVPPNTGLTVHVRSGNTPIPDQTWGSWTTDFTVSPANLRTGMPFMPFDMSDSFLQVEFTFTTQQKDLSPKLKSFDVGFKCNKIG